MNCMPVFSFSGVSLLHIFWCGYIFAMFSVIHAGFFLLWVLFFIFYTLSFLDNLSR